MLCWKRIKMMTTMVEFRKVENLRDINREIKRLKAERIAYKAMLREDLVTLKSSLQPKELMKEMLHESTDLTPGKRQWISDGITTIAGVVLDRVFLKKMSFKQAMKSTVKEVAMPALITRIKDVFLNRKKHQPV